MYIRNARKADREAIRAVTLSAYQEYAAAMPPLHFASYRQSILATLAEEGPAECIVAEQAGQIVGSVLLFPAGATLHTPAGHVTLTWPEVRLLAVAPSARGQGVGLALMQECIRRAQRAGAAVLTLHTTELMQAAMRLYERLGFVRAPELDFRPAKDVLVKGYRLNLADTVI